MRDARRTLESAEEFDSSRFFLEALLATTTWECRGRTLLRWRCIWERRARRGFLPRLFIWERRARRDCLLRPHIWERRIRRDSLACIRGARPPIPLIF